MAFHAPAADESVAVVGMAGRFPGAPSTAALWDLLRAGREGISFFSEEEMLESNVPAEVLGRPNYVPAKGYLAGALDFDAELFGYSPREAQRIDPQQRLLLECCWEALEDAGCDPDRFDGLIGVFAGVGMNMWVSELIRNEEVRRTLTNYQVMISNDKDYAATRVSYQLNLRGPSIAVQTACSTSLVAVERACQSLIDGECDLALAGGASLTFPRKSGYLYEDGLILSPDGHCRPFDARAQGTVPGEGAGIVALKRLSEARNARDPIYAVIKGWAVNNDGAMKVGYTAPSVAGQAAVIAMAQSFAGAPAESISYVEAHGTATPLGDPIEIAALAEAFRSQTTRRGFCRIGSVKSNLGHLDAAAGVAGLIKTALALHHRLIPASLHFERPNPQIDLAGSPFVVNAAATPWPASEAPRRAGVSSFGIGGTNCHLILEEAPAAAPVPAAKRPQLLVVSAASEAAADAAVERLQQHRVQYAEQPGRDVAYTLQTGRRALEHRRICLADDGEPLDRSRWAAEACPVRDPRVTFLLPGQGSQFSGMGRGLYQTQPAFRAAADRCLEELEAIGFTDLRRALFPASGERGAADDALCQTVLAQPAIFIVSYALAQFYRALGLEPDSFVGHSLGELTAACLADVIDLDAALRMICRRAELMQAAPPGAMLALGATEEEARDLLGPDLCLAAVNAPGMTVVAGTLEAIDDLEQRLRQTNTLTQRLRVGAFHSPLMEPAQKSFADFVRQISLRPPRIRFISNVTGDWITDADAVSADYWASQLRSAVRFQQGISQFGADATRIFLEVGPGSVLESLVRRTLKPGAYGEVLASLPETRGGEGEFKSLLTAAGRLWLHGASLQWQALHGDDRPRRVRLPGYPFQRKHFGVQPDAAAMSRHDPRQVERESLDQWFYAPSWSRGETPPAQEPQSPTGWLVFADALGYAEALTRRLRDQGHRVHCVRPGKDFRRVDDHAFEVRPAMYGDYSRLLREATSDGRVTRILHLWTLTGGALADGLELRQETGFYSLLFLCKALGRLPAVDDVQIQVVSDQVQDVLGTESLSPAKAMLRAPLLVAPQEYPHVRCRHIDLKATRSPSRRRRQWLVDRLWEELQSPLHETEIAWRGKRRWVRQYSSLTLPPKAALPASFQSKGAWLVLGGLGQIGLTVATWLAETCRPPLVLVGRSDFPDPSEWKRWLEEHDSEAELSRRVRSVEQLQAAGSAVRVISADISQPDQLRAAGRLAVAQFGRISGVVHSAGLVESRIMHYTSPSDCQRLFQAKVQSLDAVADFLEEFKAPLCVVNSSISAILGGLGFAAYTASNLYLDAYLTRQNRRGQARWVGINWDGWLFPRVAELFADDPAVRLTLTPEEGRDCLGRILASGHSRVVVSTGDLKRRLRLWVERAPSDDLLPDEPVLQDQNRHPRPAGLSVPYAAPRDDAEREIVEVWEELLGIDGIGVDDAYLELGGHSLLAAQVVSRLRERLQTPLSIRSLFEFPTPARLAQHVAAVRRTIAPDHGASPDRIEVEL